VAHAFALMRRKTLGSRFYFCRKQTRFTLGGTAKGETDGWYRRLNGSVCFNPASIMPSIIVRPITFDIA
jgi:hypothetical protein